MKRLLYPLSWGYGAGVALRNRAFELGILKSNDLDVPVVSVGNVVTGGTGKTPLSEYIAAYFTQHGKKTAIVSRGYRRKSSGVVVVSDGTSVLVDSGRGGDEPVQMAEKLPGVIVVVGEKRVEAAREARSLGAEVIVADDAFQHRYLGRSLNILVLDSGTDITGEHLLPVGRMREPLDAVRRADFLVFSGVPDSSWNPAWVSKLDRISKKPAATFGYRPLKIRYGADRKPASDVSKERFLAFSGIGNHAGFLSSLESSGLAVSADMDFPDHHFFSRNDFRGIEQAMSDSGCSSCVTTEKDIVRLRQDDGATRFLVDCRVYYLPVDIEFLDGEQDLQEQLDNVFSSGKQQNN